VTEYRTHPAEPNAIEIPRDSAIANHAEEQAGCGGRVFLNIITGELWLTDSPGLILWRGQLWPHQEQVEGS
jgi:hypothetical protein